MNEAAHQTLPLPEIFTYEATDLDLETAFTGGTSGGSDRRSKSSVRPLSSSRVLRSLITERNPMNQPAPQPLPPPDVTTYESMELNLNPVFTVPASVDSDRGIKRAIRRVAPRRILKRLD